MDRTGQCDTPGSLSCFVASAIRSSRQSLEKGTAMPASLVPRDATIRVSIVDLNTDGRARRAPLHSELVEECVNEENFVRGVGLERGGSWFCFMGIGLRQHPNVATDDLELI